LAEVSKEIQGILVIGLVLIVVGAVGIVVLGDENGSFQDLDLSTGFGIIPDINEVPITFTDPGILADPAEHTIYLVSTPILISLLLLLVAILLWWWKIKK
jgi:hypothetical protein